MYRTCTDPYATLCTQVRAAERLAETQQRLADDYADKLRRGPLAETIPAHYAYGREPVVIGREVVAFVLETATDPDATLAEAMFNSQARERLIEMFCAARAEIDAAEANDLADARAEAAAESEWERQREERIFEAGGL